MSRKYGIQNGSKLAEVISAMPRLRHTVGKKYDPDKSEVVRWLLANPEIVQDVFSRARRYMQYDLKDGTWRGMDVDQE